MTRHIIDISCSILQALHRLNELSGGVMTLVVVNENRSVAGTVTDGDIRRGLLRGVTLNDSVASVMHTNCTWLPANGNAMERVQIIKRARQLGITLLPELNDAMQLVGLLDLTHCETLLPLTAILMAGGKGERLRPLTLDTPKPLLKIGGRPIIDYNVENLARCGIADVWVTVKYLAEQMREFFATPHHGIVAKCVEEQHPMGTIGAASLVPLSADGNTLVMNSDLLTTVNLEEMYLHHVERKADVTIAAIPYTVSVPYAILSTDDCRVKSLDEKPTYSYFANAGIYIFANRVLAMLNQTERTDATDLIEMAISKGMTVCYYPINGTWIDIGSPADFRHAEELMQQHRSLTKLSN